MGDLESKIDKAINNAKKPVITKKSLVVILFLPLIILSLAVFTLSVAKDKPLELTSVSQLSELKGNKVAFKLEDFEYTDYTYERVEKNDDGPDDITYYHYYKLYLENGEVLITNYSTSSSSTASANRHYSNYVGKNYTATIKPINNNTLIRVIGSGKFSSDEVKDSYNSENNYMIAHFSDSLMRTVSHALLVLAIVLTGVFAYIKIRISKPDHSITWSDKGIGLNDKFKRKITRKLDIT